MIIIGRKFGIRDRSVRSIRCLTSYTPSAFPEGVVVSLGGAEETTLNSVESKGDTITGARLGGTRARMHALE